ncbi:MAG: hypothetical protein EXS36_00805 [Pedosphaera sp.]|nr:hypothetical protein [Pedosphaera sp.]
MLRSPSRSKASPLLSSSGRLCLRFLPQLRGEVRAEMEQLPGPGGTVHRPVRRTGNRAHVGASAGGALTAVEFRVALALGASTATVHCTGGAADAILNDDLWRGTPT